LLRNSLHFFTYASGFLVGLALADTTLLAERAQAQATAPKMAAKSGAATANVTVPTSQPSYTYLFVNPNTGQDTDAGNQQAPFKTLTRALEVASPNTIIVLSAGTYSAATGEQFPLVMKSGVTIQGDPATRGQQVVIQGSGFYLSRSFARQKVALLGANRAGLQGVTVSNPESQGYGLWIESTSPVISDNTFTGSSHDGVSIVGNSAPVLHNNYFYDNGANGITIYGNSRPVLIENIFENTGFGINIAQNAAPQVIGNRITRNKDGIVVQGRAQPILRQNVIDGNQRDGIVAIAQSRPDLGNTAEPGGNHFFGNGQLDINAKISNQRIPVVGSQFANSTGQLDYHATATVSSIAQPQPVAIGLVDRGRNSRVPNLLSAKASSPAPATQPVGQPPVVAPATLPTVRLSPRQVTPPLTKATTTLRPEDLAAALPLATSGRSLPQAPRSIAAPAPLPTRPESVRPLPLRPLPPRPLQPLQSPQTLAPTSTRNSSEAAIEIPVPPPESVLSVTPATDANLLPVPSSTIPTSNAAAAAAIPLWQTQQPSQPGDPPAPPLASLPTVRYRVLVEARNPTDVTLAQQLSPDAFTTQVRGRTMVQMGAFSDRSKAETLLNQLLIQGLPARLEP
jgi:parallel beta-helix repeat protein